MTADLYAEHVKALARRARSGQALENPGRTACVRNPMCGDEVRVSVRFRADGGVDLGYSVRGCLLTLAACARMAEIAAADPDRARLAGAVARIEAMFDAGIPAEMGMFGPARAHRSRHECVLIPFRALGGLLREGDGAAAPRTARPGEA